MDLQTKEQIEIDYWKNSSFESPEIFTRHNFLNKLSECRHFDYKVSKYIDKIQEKRHILEIGAGQGWASCFLKRFIIPGAHFTVTDISPFALKGLPHWESVFDVKIDSAIAAKSYDLGGGEARFDLIFCYASAHHFVKYRETLTELNRILKPGGHILFLYEPTASHLTYKWYYRYVNKMPHSTPEDVIIPSDIEKIAQEIELEYTHVYDAHQTVSRSLVISVYFKLIGTFGFLQRYLPSSSDLIFYKPG